MNKDFLLFRSILLGMNEQVVNDSSLQSAGVETALQPLQIKVVSLL